MIAQLPVNSLSEGAPDPQLAANAQRETKRLIDMSRGVLQICVGVCCLFAAGLYLQTWWPLDKTMQIILVPVLLLIPGVLFQLAVMRARQRAGIPKVTLRSQLIPVGQRWVMGMLFVVFVGITVFLDSWGIDSKLHDVITNLALALILAFPMVWRGVHLRLWEHLLIAASFPVGVGLLVTQAAELRLGWLCLVLGLGQLIAGYSLHRRWIAWVHALPRTTHMTDTNDSEVSA